MKTTFEKDLYRYYGGKKRTIKQLLFPKPEIKYIYLFRKCQSSKGLLQLFFRFLLRRMSLKTGIQISYETQIAEGFSIGHRGVIIINPNATIGRNVSVSPGVVIGQENRGQRKGCPAIGDCCWIGSNAVIVGKVKIGNDVLIAPNAFVNFDVPDHSVVIGNPGKIIENGNATRDYLDNLV